MSQKYMFYNLKFVGISYALEVFQNGLLRESFGKKTI